MNFSKHFSLLILLYIVGTNIFSQQVLNGGFEDTNEINYDTKWYFLFGAGCFDPPFPNWAVISNEANNGVNALLLTPDMCYPVGSLMPGHITTRDFEPHSPVFGYEYHDRPANLNFYYKYEPFVHDEKAFVKIMLFKYDYGTFAVTEVIGVGEANIIETPTYTLQTVPIDYYTESIPDYLHILFSTSENFSYYQNQPIYNVNTDNVNSLGTNLWIDDVYVSGGTIGVNEGYLNMQIELYPNPVTNLLNIDSIVNIQKVQVFNNLGQVVLDKQTSFDNIDVSNLVNGTYVVKIETERVVLFKKVIKH